MGRQGAERFTYKRVYLEGPPWIPKDEVEDLLARLVADIYLADHPELLPRRHGGTAEGMVQRGRKE